MVENYPLPRDTTPPISGAQPDIATYDNDEVSSVDWFRVVFEAAVRLLWACNLERRLPNN